MNDQQNLSLDISIKAAATVYNYHICVLKLDDIRENIMSYGVCVNDAGEKKKFVIIET